MSSGWLIKIRDTSLVYLTPDDIIDDEGDDLIGMDRFEDQAFRDHPRLRRVLTTLSDSSPRFFGFLHWSDGSNLAELDERVTSGVDRPDDFANALLTEVATKSCRMCGATLRVGIVDTGAPLVTASLLREHRFVRTCPFCGSPFGFYVTEVFDLEWRSRGATS